MTAGHRLHDAIVGAASVLVVYAGVPAVLVVLVGAPVPRHWDAAAVLSLRGLFDALTVVAWLAWAACAVPLLRAVVSRVRRRDVVAGEAATIGDRLALRIALGVLALSPVAISSAAGAAAGTPPAVVAAAGPSAAPPGPAAAPAPTPALPPAALATTVTVAPGDTLWSIAQACYGDPADWTALAAANLGRAMGNGRRFVDPSLIEPGWVLVLPALDPAPAAAEGGAPAGASSPPSTAPQSAPGATGRNPRPAVTDTNGATPRDAGRRPPPRPAATAADAGPGRPGPTGGAPPAHPGPGFPDPFLGAFGMGAIVTGLCARRMTTRRRWLALSREEGDAQAGEEDAAAVDLAVAIESFARLPLVELVELGARDLGRVRAGDGRVPGPVRLLRAGSDGLEARLDAPAPPPPGWERAGEEAWVLPGTTDPGVLAARAAGHAPWTPVLLPLGDGDAGTWLVALEPGEALCVLGVAADELVAAMRVALERWTWHDLVAVTEDPAEVDPGRVGPGAVIVFVGDAGELEPTARASCAVVTTRPWEAAVLTVVVDHRAATVHPCGLTLRPHLLAPGAVAALEALEAPPREPVGLPTWTGGSDDSPANAGELGAPSAVCVRLLTPVPRIDGLGAPLPAKRARRAVEVVAYLALHHPQPVTGDRLRARVLGSPDVDAASKTLFNTAGAARASLGAGPDGLALLPPATRDGQYRVSPLVAVDALRAVAFLRAGLAEPDAPSAIALLREGLALIEGEPLAGMLTGYAWWRAEGHERRLADAVTDGACRLVRLALAAGQIDLARWALDQARLVEPYSELLSRSAMETAAASGDARRLQAEWASCQRQMDDIDPGGFPSPATEKLYARLRAQLGAEDVAPVPG